MVIGVGIDMIEISRIEKAASKAAFLSRVFSGRELELFRERGENIKILAGCFAGKEAVSKALGTGFAGFWPSDVEVLRDGNGKPFVVLNGKAGEIAADLGVRTWHISITNTAEYAAAFVIAEM
ncbi:MAG: holo-ACP synthase [Defluviitaleaceae bacterium]|nr:holo-ACP synthase [Defluviitaleaceae bacterium]MCL2836005.1 holo-ACP synthase [Defluviitaleaceae bacterium]